MTADGSETGAATDPVAPQPVAMALPLPDDLPSGLRRAADLSQLKDPRLLRALAWWQSLPASADSIPDRHRLDPAAIPDLLPWSILWDVLPPAAPGPGSGSGTQGSDRVRYRCRLAGTMLNDIYGREARGQWLHEQFGDQSEAMQQEYDAVVQLRRPLCGQHRMNWADKPYYRYLRLMLPFTHQAPAPRSDPQARHDDATRVALIFSVISFIGE